MNLIYRKYERISGNEYVAKATESLTSIKYLAIPSKIDIAELLRITYGETRE